MPDDTKPLPNKVTIHVKQPARKWTWEWVYGPGIDEARRALQAARKEIEAEFRHTYHDEL